MIGNNVNEIIKQKGVKIGAIASVLNISRTALYKKLNGERSFKAEELMMLSEFLNVPIETFYGSSKASGNQSC